MVQTPPLETAFSSPEPTILLACGRNRELWEKPFWNKKGNNRILPIRFHAIFVYGACLKWLLAELSILSQARRIVGSGDENAWTHSRPQSPRSFWPVAGIESSGLTRFSEYAQSIRFVFSTNQIWWEVRESRTSGVRPSQSTRSLPQARRIVGSGDDNGLNCKITAYNSCAILSKCVWCK